MTAQQSTSVISENAPTVPAGKGSSYEQAQSANREFWDQQARRKGTAATCRSDWIAASTLRCLQNMAADSQRILEVGCGDGNLIGNLAVGGERTGLDQSPVMLEQARERFGDVARFVEGDATRLPFGDGEFDLSYSSRCLINVQDPDMQLQAMRELVRVTKPGGSIVLAENFTEGWDGLRKLRSRPWLPSLGGVGIQKPLDFDRVVALFEEEGCRLARWHQYRLTNLFYHGLLIVLFRTRGIGMAERLFLPILNQLTRLDSRLAGKRPLIGKDTTLHFVVGK
jgi:SAM-dependent methyltransferase